jgi:hypothetical protein
MTNSPALLFNAHIAVSAMAAASEPGLLNRLREIDEVDLLAWCEGEHLHLPTALAVVRTLAAFGILLADDVGKVRRGGEFDAFFRHRGFFVWLARGYGGLWQHLAEVARLANRSADAEPKIVLRSARAIATGAAACGLEFVDRHVHDMLQGSYCSMACDLGCGNGERLIRMARQHPSTASAWTRASRRWPPAVKQQNRPAWKIGSLSSRQTWKN